MVFFSLARDSGSSYGVTWGLRWPSPAGPFFRTGYLGGLFGSGEVSGGRPRCRIGGHAPPPYFFFGGGAAAVAPARPAASDRIEAGGGIWAVFGPSPDFRFGKKEHGGICIWRRC